MRPIDPDGRARLCGACDKPVYDTRSLTRRELARLILKHEGTLPCLRLHRRPDGTVVTWSCFAPVLRAGRFLWLRVGLAAAAFWTIVIASWSWTRRATPSVITSASQEVAEAETRKARFVIKPPADPPAPRSPRKLGPRSARTTYMTLGEAVIEKDVRLDVFNE
jgi:hypothetical protein